MVAKSGILSKMRVSLDESGGVLYHARLADDELSLNEAIGKAITITHLGNINCTYCGRKTKKSYSGGYCYPCSQNLAQCDLCIVRPHTCHYHLGTCREPGWGEAHCMQPHIVYLANSSGLKVGITRHTQIPTRWIDQGAQAAIPILQTSSRYLAGLIEKCLSNELSDKTDWRKMLRGEPESVDLVQKRAELLGSVEEAISQAQQKTSGEVTFSDAKPLHIKYPVLTYPVKVKSYNLDKTPVVEDTLKGIKGQYLIMEEGVINLRKYTGYDIQITLHE